MESITKTAVSQETIAILVHAHLGTQIKIKEIIPLTAGYFNTAYAVHFSNFQPDVVIRISPDPTQRVLTYEKDLMRREIIILETIQEIESIPFKPKLVGYDLSRQHINRDYMFVEKLSGVALNVMRDTLNPENLKDIERQVGRYAAQLGDIRGDHFGYFGNGLGNGSRSWQKAFLTIMEALLQDGEDLGVKLTIPWDDLRSLIHTNAEPLVEISEPALVHWDLWAGNVFVKHHNEKYVIEGIIDWERALWGDPDFETAVSCRFYGPAFYEGYGKQLADRGPEAVRQSLYRLYLWLVLIIEAKVRYEDADHLPWAHEQLEKELKFIDLLDYV